MNISNGVGSGDSFSRRSALAGAQHSVQYIECGGEQEFDIRLVQYYAFAWFQKDATTVRYR